MGRIIEPPRDQHAKLRTPLTDGERRLVDLFDKRLSRDWEIYIQPHLNGLRPDIVLLNPSVGVAVFEVKDWDLNKLAYSRDESGRLHASDGLRQFRVEDPDHKIRLYQQEIMDLYCPRLKEQEGLAAITAGLVFPFACRADGECVLAKRREPKVAPYLPVAYREDLERGALDVIFPGSGRSFSKLMTPETARDLRGWLTEPFSSKQQRRPLELDRRQADLVQTRTATGYRRIKGPAGSGKSTVVAARASVLAEQGKHVLIAAYNITLLNYLRDMAGRGSRNRSVILRQIDFLNFHRWCKRVCMSAGWEAEYKALWKGLDGDVERPGLQLGHDARDEVLEEKMAELVVRIYSEDGHGGGLPRYDAILVDEGQDYRLSWWNALRSALRPGGEMLLVADKTQNVYGTASVWTDEAMKGAGFSGGGWARLEQSHRLPYDLISQARRFATDFMRDQEIDVPGDRQLEFRQMSPVRMRWVQVSDAAAGVKRCVEEVREMQLAKDTARSDVVVLVQLREQGLQFVEQISPWRVVSTFAADKREEPRLKRAFFQGDARIKASTIHSFKGWEGRHIVLLVSDIKQKNERALFYTALTRVLGDANGSSLIVVSCCPELEQYGRGWPDFQHV